MKANSKVNSKIINSKVKKIEKHPIKKDTKKIEAKVINSLTKNVKSTTKKTDDIDLIFSKKKSTTSTPPSSDINDIDLIFSKKKATPTTKVSTSTNKVLNGKGAKTITAKKTPENNSDKLLSLLGTKKSKKKAATSNTANKEKTSVNDNSKIVIASSGAKKPKNTFKPKDDDGFGDSRGLNSGRRTEDGLRIFTIEELRIGEGEGDTPLCPFDCNCCF